MSLNEIKKESVYHFKNHKVSDKEDVIYLIPVFQDQEPLSILKLTDKSEVVTEIKNNYRSGNFHGKLQEMLNLSGQGVILGGLGKSENFHPERLMSVMRAFASSVKKLEKASFNIIFNNEIKEAVETFDKIARGEKKISPAANQVDESSKLLPSEEEPEEEITPEYFSPYTLEEAVSQSISSFLVGIETMDLLKTDNKNSKKKSSGTKKIRNIGILCAHLAGAALKTVIERGTVVGEAVNSVRTIVSLPGNYFNPDEFENYARKLAKDHSLKIKVFNQSKLASMGCGGILSVGRGSEIPPRMIVLEYKPNLQKKLPRLALVGKGITFDTGGISLKPPSDMHEMKYDMCGAALVLHAVSLAKERNLPLEVVALLGIAENMPGSKALKPGDVYTAYNGLNVEVQNTDAEGRLVLGDVLSYACDVYDPDYLMDFATLTGACVVALGHEAAGVMTSDENLAEKINLACRKSLDRSWRLPHWFSYGKGLKSDIADIRNIAGREGGTVSAMRFLASFVKSHISWAHFDIAGTAWRNKASGTQPKGATGWGMRFLNQFMENIAEKDN